MSLSPTVARPTGDTLMIARTQVMNYLLLVYQVILDLSTQESEKPQTIENKPIRRRVTRGKIDQKNVKKSLKRKAVIGVSREKNTECKKKDVKKEKSGPGQGFARGPAARSASRVRPGYHGVPSASLHPVGEEQGGQERAGLAVGIRRDGRP